MTTIEEIRSVSANLQTQELLRYLIQDKFPGKTVVTASLMAASVAVLKMISEIDRKTPVIFCHRSPVFPESIEYRERITGLLGLENYVESQGLETDVQPGDTDHCERMWVGSNNLQGRSFQLLHLNDNLAPYDCWISAIYHVPRPSSARQRVDVEGRLIRIDPLLRWSKDDIREFMRANRLPYHKQARRNLALKDTDEGSMLPNYNY